MTVEQNLRMVDFAFEAINAQDWDYLYGLHVDNIVMHMPDLAHPVKGRESVHRRLQAYAKAFPDFSWTRLRGFGQGDWVCAEVLLKGTHKGPLERSDGESIPPTGRTVELPSCVVFGVNQGEIFEARIYFDQLDFMRQLGILQ